MLRFIHTADWQLGKPFARVSDPEKRARVRQERLAVIGRIGEAVRAHQAAFVLVAGDLFDSTTSDKSTVAAACSAIGALQVPVLAIPGNHDHAGPGTVWAQPFFRHEQQALAPNFRLLDAAVPVEIAGALVLPCPLARRQDVEDPTAWLRDPALWATLPADRPRIVLAHGSTQGFAAAADEEDGHGASNRIALEALGSLAIDYIALGDWHGMRRVGERAWYSGTPEPDRFPRGADYEAGQVLAVTLAGRGQPPTVTAVPTARLRWWREAYHLVEAASLYSLEAHLESRFGGRTQEDLLRLELSGALDFGGERLLRERLERWEARLLRLKVVDHVQIVPSDDELARLTGRAGDPLISGLALRLVDARQQEGEVAVLARRALRELYAAVEQAGSPR